MRPEFLLWKFVKLYHCTRSDCRLPLSTIDNPKKVDFTGGLNFENATHSNITIRKFFFNNAGVQATTGNVSNFVIENCIFYGFSGYMSLQSLTGTPNIVINNTFLVPT